MALAGYRFSEFAHWAEVWVQLAKTSGEQWTNPFGAVAAAVRTHRAVRRGRSQGNQTGG